MNRALPRRRDPARRHLKAGRTARGFARTVVALRFLILPAWIAAAVAAVTYLPAFDTSAASGLGAIVPEHSAAIDTEKRSLREFDLPVLSRIAVVQRNPRGLPLLTQLRAVARAVQIDLQADTRNPGIRGALPLLNTLRLVPASSESSTTAITYLFADPHLNLYGQQAAARRFVTQDLSRKDDAFVGLAGSIPARVQQANRITAALPFVELATVLFIALVVGLYFRAIGAPLVVLAAAAIGYLIATHLLAWLGQRARIAVPAEMEPLIVVLLLGVVTDYAIFFLSGMRYRLTEVRSAAEAARGTVTEFAPITSGPWGRDWPSRSWWLCSWRSPSSPRPWPCSGDCCTGPVSPRGRSRRSGRPSTRLPIWRRRTWKRPRRPRPSRWPGRGGIGPLGSSRPARWPSWSAPW